MDIYIAADHRGFKLKTELAAWLAEEGHVVKDLGAATYTDGDDYPDYGAQVAHAVAEAPTDRRGIALCGSGVGMAVVANKVKGIRAALMHDPAVAEAGQRDDNVNVLALGADFLTLGQAKAVITAWLTTPFSNEERHHRRIAKIAQYE